MLASLLDVNMAKLQAKTIFVILPSVNEYHKTISNEALLLQTLSDCETTNCVRAKHSASSEVAGWG